MNGVRYTYTVTIESLITLCYEGKFEIVKVILCYTGPPRTSARPEHEVNFDCPQISFENSKS